MVDYLLKEIGRVFWNKNQEEWDMIENPKLNGVIFNSFYWGDDPTEQELPNLKIGKQEIRWYKYPGRNSTSLLEFTPNEWKSWFDEAIKIIQKNDTTY